ADRVEQGRLTDARFLRDTDLVELARLPEQALRRAQLKAGERGAADIDVRRPESDETGDLERLRAPLRLDLDRVADLNVLLVRGGAVDHDLVRRRPVAV